MTTTIAGVTITLTNEQIAQIEKQLAPPPTQNIMDKVKSWEDAGNLCNPRWWVRPKGQFEKDNRNFQSSTDASNVTSQARAKSVLAYCQLSVIADALNEGWKPDWQNDTVSKWLVYCNKGQLTSVHYTQNQLSTIYFASMELAEYSIKQFPQLWYDYFMVENPNTSNERIHP